MRILFLAHRLPYPPNKGDKIRSFWELMMLGRSHSVDLFTFYDDPWDEKEVAGASKYCRSCYAEPLSPMGSRIRAMSAVIARQSFSNAFYYSRTMMMRISEAVKVRPYDLIFVFGSAMAQYAEPWPSIPTILDCVDVDSDKWMQYSRRSRRPMAYLWMIEGRRLEKAECSYVAKFANTLLCTDAEANLLRTKVPAGRINVLQNSLDMGYFRPSAVDIPENIRRLQPYLLFSGQMDYFPNVDAVQWFVREIFPIIRRRAPDVKFVIAGRNPSLSVKRLAVDDSIHVTGSVPDMRPYLRGAKVAAAPMRIARGVQNKILEALAMDVPVVASSGAAKALPSEISSLVAAEDEPNGIADRVLEYLSGNGGGNGQLRAAVGRYVEELNLPSQLEQYVRAAAARSAGCLEDRVALAV